MYTFISSEFFGNFIIFQCCLPNVGPINQGLSDIAHICANVIVRHYQFQFYSPITAYKC